MRSRPFYLFQVSTETTTQAEGGRGRGSAAGCTRSVGRFPGTRDNSSIPQVPHTGASPQVVVFSSINVVPFATELINEQRLKRAKAGRYLTSGITQQILCFDF